MARRINQEDEITKLARTKNKEQMSELIATAEEAVAVVSDCHDLLSVDQVAVQLGVSPQTVRNWESKGVLLPTSRTEGGHRRYSQKSVTDMRRNQRDFEVFLTAPCSKIATSMIQIFSNFNPDEKISITIRSDKLNGMIHFTLDSEDGLQTYTKTLKVED